MYPKTVYMPGSGVQAGTVLLTDGDPLTPFYPAVGEGNEKWNCDMRIISEDSLEMRTYLLVLLLLVLSFGMNYCKDGRLLFGLQMSQSLSLP